LLIFPLINSLSRSNITLSTLLSNTHKEQVTLPSEKQHPDVFDVHTK